MPPVALDRSPGEGVEPRPHLEAEALSRRCPSTARASSSSGAVDQRRARVRERERHQPPPREPALDPRPRQAGDDPAVVSSSRTRRTRSGSGRPSRSSQSGWWNIVAPAARPTKSPQRASVRGSRSSARIPAGYASASCPSRVSARSTRLADPRWDEFVAAQPEGRLPALRLAALPAGRVRASARRPLLRGRDGASRASCRSSRHAASRCCGAAPLVGARLSSLPRTPVAGPLARDRAGGGAPAAAVERARAAGARLQVKRAAADLDGLVDGVGGAPWRSSLRGCAAGRPGGDPLRELAQPLAHQLGGQQGAKEGVEVRGPRTRGRPRVVPALPRDDARGGGPAPAAAALRGHVARARAARA